MILAVEEISTDIRLNQRMVLLFFEFIAEAAVGKARRGLIPFGRNVTAVSCGMWPHLIAPVSLVTPWCAQSEWLSRPICFRESSSTRR